MTFLDAQALVAFFAGEPAAPAVRALLREGPAVVVAANLAETVDVSIRINGVQNEKMRADVSSLVGVGLRVLPAVERDAWRAGELRARYYDRRTCAISIPDCLLVAATASDDRIATADRAVLSVARAEGIAVVPLPDSSGRLPA